VARMPFVRLLPVALTLAVVPFTGCCSPYHQDQGALFGGLLGAGTGAVIGGATGHPGAGAAIGAGVGALSGAAIGHGQDEIEAKNRAMIAQQLGRQVSAGAVRVDEVVAMSKSGVNEELIVNHIRTNGTAAPLQTADLIRLQQEGVTPRVIATMQATPPRPVQPMVVEQPGPPVVVESYPYPYYYGPRPCAHVYYRWH
jgi:hypothetical protein